jgi:hypothetical protein
MRLTLDIKGRRRHPSLESVRETLMSGRRKEEGREKNGKRRLKVRIVSLILIDRKQCAYCRLAWPVLSTRNQGFRL